MSMLSVAPVDGALAAEDSLDGNEEDMDLVDSAPVWPRSGKSYRAYLESQTPSSSSSGERLSTASLLRARGAKADRESSSPPEWDPGGDDYPMQITPPTSDNKDATGSSNSPKSSSSSEFDMQSPRGRIPTAPELLQAAFHNEQWVRRTAIRTKRGNHGGEQEGEESDSISSDSDDTKWPYGTLRQSLDQLGFLAGKEKPDRLLKQAQEMSMGGLPPLHGLQPHKRGVSDPRIWDLDGVQSWLRHESRKHGIVVDCERFHMNGKGLVLIGLQGFQRRVPGNGHLLHRDLRRLLRAQQIVQRR